jgi:hypothetical protein
MDAKFRGIQKKSEKKQKVIAEPQNRADIASRKMQNSQTKPV